jgi:hypothetical protein
MAMRQCDVLDNPIPRAQRALPFVTILQSDLAETATSGSWHRSRREPPCRRLPDGLSRS